jgi:hypothetical protein
VLVEADSALVPVLGSQVLVGAVKLLLEAEEVLEEAVREGYK